MAISITLSNYTLTIDGNNQERKLEQHIAECERVLRNFQQWRGDNKSSSLGVQEEEPSKEIQPCEF